MGGAGGRKAGEEGGWGGAVYSIFNSLSWNKTRKVRSPLENMQSTPSWYLW